MHTLGWIGLGQMGELMSMNLLQAGHKLHVYNRTIEKTQAIVDAGATRGETPAAVVEQADLIFLMLSNGAAVEAVLTEDQGVLAAITPGKIVIDMSTISPQESRTFAQMVAERGGVYVDAPVSGSTGAAKGAQLVVLVGGDKSTVETCKPYLDILGKKTIHFGEQSKGSSAKLAINLLLGVVGQGIAETFVLAEKAGLAKEDIIEMISQSAMNTPLFQGKRDMYRDESFPSAFMLELMAKDLGLIADEASKLEVELPLAGVARQTYQSAKESGKGKMDMAAIYLELKEQNQ